MLTNSVKKIPDLLFKLMHWETWPYLVKYIPLSPIWFWYCLKARSFWFFTPSNPTITFGGFEGESKSEMYQQLPKGTYPNTIIIKKEMPLAKVKALMQTAGLAFPIAVKPNAGMMGFMFRQLKTEEQLATYHSVMPCDYIIQDYIHYPVEVSIFYYRYPGSAKGKITGFLKKENLQVTGDGFSDLDTLIEKYDRVRFRKEEMKNKHLENLKTVLGKGENYCLSYALNLSRGGKLVNLEHEKNEALLSVFDGISNYTRAFYYGRYDIKCESIENLKAGEKFSILEYNGSGAEPHHIYGNNNSLIAGWKILLQHWKVLYEISEINKKQGHEQWKFTKGYHYLKNAKQHFKVLKALDAQYKV